MRTRKIRRFTHSGINACPISPSSQTFKQGMQEYDKSRYYKDYDVNPSDRYIFAASRLENRGTRLAYMEKLKRGTVIEHKEHPELSEKDAENIAADHLMKDINSY